MLVTSKPMTPDEVLAFVGSPKTVDQKLKRYERSARALSKKRLRLIDKYPSRWVAVHDGRVKVSARSLSKLLEKVSAAELSRENVIVRRLDRKQRTMIL